MILAVSAKPPGLWLSRSTKRSRESVGTSKPWLSDRPERSREQTVLAERSSNHGCKPHGTWLGTRNALGFPPE